MRRNWMLAALPALLVLGIAAGAAPSEAKSSRGSGAAPTASRSKAALHQFTGLVTAMDKTSLTVEKAGKKPQTRTFARDEQTLTSGELAKDARVTVFYREENGRAVAHRVVVKAGPSEASR